MGAEKEELIIYPPQSTPSEVAVSYHISIKK